MTDVLALNSIRGKSGKDTLIGLLESEGRKVFRVAFADVLKEMCALALAGGPGNYATELQRRMHTSQKDEAIPLLSVAQLPDSEYKSWLFGHESERATSRSLRWHLQTFGTAYHREFLGKPNYWLDKGLEEVRKGLDDASNEHVVITDMRMVNEYEAMCYGRLKFDVKPVRIVRDWFIPGVDDQTYHISDIALMAHPFDALVVNRLGEPWAMLDQLKEQGVIN